MGLGRSAESVVLVPQRHKPYLTLRVTLRRQREDKEMQDVTVTDSVTMVLHFTLTLTSYQTSRAPGWV